MRDSRSDRKEGDRPIASQRERTTSKDDEVDENEEKDEDENGNDDEDEEKEDVESLRRRSDSSLTFPRALPLKSRCSKCAESRTRVHTARSGSRAS